MNKIKYIAGVVFLVIGIYNFRMYADFKQSISLDAQIAYTYIDKKINIGGRSNSYDMLVMYKGKEHVIRLTSKEFKLLDQRVYPTLYESKTSGRIFSQWTTKSKFRIAMVCIFIFLVAVLPWESVLYKLVSKKRKSLTLTSKDPLTRKR